MSTDTLLDKYEKVGQPDGDATDTLSASPIGGDTVPAAADRLVYYPFGGGVAAPAPGDVAGGGGGGATPFLLDSSSYARALTAAGGAVQVPSGKYGSALDNRTIGASGVSTPDASELYFGTLAVPFCIEAWVKFNAVGTGVFVSQWATSNMAWWMGYSASNTVAFVYSANGSTQGGIVAQPWTPTVGVWYHVCANRTAGNVCNVYVDGVRLATTPTGFQFFNSTAALMIGNAVSGLSAFNGYIDEVRVSKVDRYGAVASFTPPSAAFVSDADTLLLAHF